MNNKIPVYINNFNRLATTRGMVEYLRTIPAALPIIVDNDSTYPPLIDWYRTCDCEIVLLGDNGGPRAPWEHGCIDLQAEYYAVSDSDLDLSGIPVDVLDVLGSGLRKYPGIIKAGLSLEINDLRDDHPIQRQARAWEGHYWNARVDEKFFDAATDTTFALYRRGDGYGGWAPALRADRPYCARHVPFYRSAEEWDEEERYYADHCNRDWATVVRTID